MSSYFLVTCDDCGHRGTYRSADLARFHFSRHSCALVRERRDRAARRLRRLASEGEKRDCQHARANHKHGTRTAYVLDRCRCYDCKVASRKAEQQRTRDRAYGRPANLVDTQPVREHLQQLMAAGMGANRISEVSGVHKTRLADIIYGRGSNDPRERRKPRIRIRPDIAERLLAVKLDLAAGAHIDGTGTTRRVQALVAVGWSMSKIAVAIGMHASNFTAVAHGRRDVTVRTTAAVAELYDQWWDQKPPTTNRFERTAYTRALKYADEHRWLPPLAFDDDDIDDPAAQPIEAPVPIHRGPRSTVHPEDVEWLLESGAALPEILHRLGVSKNTLEITLKRHGRCDVWQQVSAKHRLRSTAPRRVA